MLSMIADTEPMEERLLGYLRRYIGNLRVDELFTFLRFVAGSQACTEPIKVIFNKQDGFALRPIAHTCGFIHYLHFIC